MSESPESSPFVIQSTTEFNQTVDGAFLSHFIKDGHLYIDALALDSALAENFEAHIAPLADNPDTRDDPEVMAWATGVADAIVKVGKYLETSDFSARMIAAMSGVE